MIMPISICSYKKHHQLISPGIYELSKHRLSICRRTYAVCRSTKERFCWLARIFKKGKINHEALRVKSASLAHIQISLIPLHYSRALFGPIDHDDSLDLARSRRDPVAELSTVDLGC